MLTQCEWSISSTTSDRNSSLPAANSYLRQQQCCLPQEELVSNLDAYAKFPKASIGSLMSVCLSVRIEQLGSHRAEFYETWELKFFENLPRKIQVSLKSDKNNGTLYEDRCAFILTRRWNLLRITNVSGKICRENQNTDFKFKNIFSPKKIFPFLR